jgi:hypothetical protein
MSSKLHSIADIPRQVSRFCDRIALITPDRTFPVGRHRSWFSHEAAVSHQASSFHETGGESVHPG